MKNIYIVFLAIFIISCSSDSNEISDTNETPDVIITPFSINVSTSNKTVNVDQDVVVNITCEDNLKGIGYSFDNFNTSSTSFPGQGFGTSAKLNFRFGNIGEKTIFFKGVKNDDSSSEIKSITFNVVKGNNVRITALKINSFDRINGSWDPEYAETDSNRLADVGFGITKINFSNPFEGTKRQYSWYISEVKQNQGDLNWNLESANLYLDPNLPVLFSLADVDEYPLGQDLTMTSSGLSFSLKQYVETKPKTVTVSFPDNKLEFVLQLEWPN